MEYTIPVPDLDEFNGLPEAVRDKVRRRLASFARAAALMSGGELSQGRALHAAASTAPGCAYGSLKRYYKLYRETGDWRCMLDERHEAAPRANRDLSAWARALAGANKRGTGRGSAWRAGILELVSGKRIAGYGTWQEIWRAENPGRPTPAVCPYSELRGCQPKKLSSRNFYRLAKTPKVQRALALSGTAAARMHLSPLIEFDTSLLRVLEMIVFDDVRTDWEVECEGKIVELWMLVAMDVATRKVLRFGLRPRRQRPDGTREGLTHRDMQSLICGIFRHYGVPRDYPCHLLVENAAAAVPEGFEAALLHATGGSVLVRRTSVLSGNPFMDAWGESGKGNPHAKAWLESAHNLLHNEGGAIIGQIGADYTLKSQGHEKAVAHSEKLLKQAQAVIHLTERKVHGIPFRSLQEARHDIEDIFIRMDNRQNHNLTGFDDVKVWRWTGSPVWKAWESFPRDLPKESREDIETATFRESPLMRFTRLSAGLRTAALPDSCMPALLADHLAVTYHGAGFISFVLAGRKYNFTAEDLRLTEGEPILCWFDRNRMEDGVFVTDSKGRVQGHAPRTARMSPLDAEGIMEGVKRKQKAFGKALAEFRKDTLTEEVMARRVADADANLDTIEMARTLVLNATPATTAEEAANPAAIITRAARTAKAPPAKALDSRLFSRAKAAPAEVTA